MSESRRPQRNAKTPPSARRAFLLTDLSQRSGRELGAALDDRTAMMADGWRVSCRHCTDLSPADIAELPADAMIVDGLDREQMAAARQGCRKLINISCGQVTDVESLVIDAYLAGTVAADILLRRGYRSFVAAQQTNPGLLSGFCDEIAHAGLTGEAVQFATSSEPLPSAAILAKTGNLSPDDNRKSPSVDALICIGRRLAECSLVITPSVSWLASILLQWLDNESMPLPTVPPHRADDDAVASLPDAYGDPAISAVSSYIDDQLSHGKSCKIDAIANHFSMARRTLERRFRDVAGTSIHREITRRQVARARQHLFEPDTTPATAAAAAGYSSTRMLSINFRKLTGLSPRRYQQIKILPNM